jgi:hypothetical protein
MPRKAQPTPKQDDLLPRAKLKMSGGTWGIFGMTVGNEGGYTIHGPFDTPEDAMHDDVLANANDVLIVRGRFIITTTIARYRAGQEGK